MNIYYFKQNTPREIIMNLQSQIFCCLNDQSIDCYISETYDFSPILYNQIVFIEISKNFVNLILIFDRPDYLIIKSLC